jgi:hypothetical protein
MDMNREPNVPLLSRVGDRRSPTAPPDLVTEHAALARWLGKLQRRMGVLHYDHRQQVAKLNEDVMHLRGQTLVLRTATLWGLGGLLLASFGRKERVLLSRTMDATWREASEVICQTGCAGHAHPWRDTQGLWRRTVELCQPTMGAQTEARSADRR